MKALIFDYNDDSISILPIPKEWEDNADKYVEQHPAYNANHCLYMISMGGVQVYDIVDICDLDYNYSYRITI